MRNTLGRCLAMVLTTGVFACFALAQEVSPKADWPATADAAGYGKATAHEPNFIDQTVWPLTGKEYFLKQQWPKARLLTWAHPGQSAGDKQKLDGLDPKNWIDSETGKPATSLPDKDTDVLLPASDTPYTVNWRHPGHGHNPTRLTARHVTIERGAKGNFGGDGQGMHFYGNIWVKRGGNLYCQGSCTFLGDKHTFFRNDNLAKQLNGPDWEIIQCGQYFSFNKDSNDASIEFLGHIGTKDEWKLYKGLAIVGIDTRMQPGYGCSPFVSGGCMAIMDGGVWEKRTNDFGTPCLQVNKGGVVTGGLPDRPLTRSCRIGLGFENYTNAQYDGPGAKQNSGKPATYARVASLVIGQDAVIRTYSTDIKTARLVIGRMWREDICPDDDDERAKKMLEREPDLAKRWQWERALPRGIDCFIDASAVVDGVEFDCFRKGGIMTPDPAAARTKWQNIFYGPANAAQGDELLSELAKLGKNASY